MAAQPLEDEVGEAVARLLEQLIRIVKHDGAVDKYVLARELGIPPEDISAIIEAAKVIAECIEDEREWIAWKCPDYYYY